ncbi:MAG: asparagine synthase-related protein [Pseudomonadota bacterium]
MAVIFGIRDSNQQRRELCLANADCPVGQAGVSGLVRECFHNGDVSVVTLRSASTPYSELRKTPDGNGVAEAALVVGDFNSPMPGLDLHGASRLSDMPSQVAGSDGYYFALHCDAAGVVQMGVDFLSQFPLYYWSNERVVLFGTSPELFKSHPDFSATISVDFVVATLMFSHPVSGLSLYQHVKSLQPGERIRIDADHTLAIEEAPKFFGEEASNLVGTNNALEAADECLHKYFKSLAGHSEINLLMSGGLDSRLVAAYLSTSMDSTIVRALLVGRRTDNDRACAERVTSKLGWDQAVMDANLSSGLSHAERVLKFESMGGTFADIADGTMMQLLARYNVPFVNGYFGDIVMGDRHVNVAWDADKGAFSIDRLLSSMRRYGFSDGELISLVQCGDVAERIENILGDLRKEWLEFGSDDWRRSWAFALHNRQRHHVGRTVWRHSFGAWPLLPYVSRDFVSLMGGLPTTFLEGRSLQADLVRLRSPALAKIPLDNNGRKVYYLDKPLGVHIREKLPSPVDWHWRIREMVRRWEERTERRYYFRVYDINSVGWSEIRKKSNEAVNREIPPLNTREAVRVLGDPEARIPVGDSIPDSSRFKTLMGVSLLLAGNKLEASKEAVKKTALSGAQPSRD